ncbi:MAG: GNAT family N-acetyltransferase [Ancalomicrobiaceae bacterium]|nr:GNAT family N-acetyltransferase [Ancalomicrobiaceae bacterium]
MSLEIRPARPGEAPLVLKFIGKLAEYERLSHEMAASEAALDAALFGPNPRVFCDLAFWEGEPAGFALWFYSFSTFLGEHGIYLEDLFVDVEHRGRGLGKALIIHLARRCVTEGLKRLDWQVLDWNAPSIAFYQSIGAVVRSEWVSNRLSGDALVRLAESG